MRIVLLGAPGSGKGTQAQRLRDDRRIPQISSGDLLRDAVARGTGLGKRAKAAMDLGELVSDDIVLGLIRERLGRPDAANGFILDGYPRNVAQADSLDGLLADLRQPIDAVVLMDIDPAVLFKRLTGRRSCPKCGKVFNIYTSPSKRGDITLWQSYVRGRVHTNVGRVLLEDVGGNVRGTSAHGTVTERRVERVPTAP
jgi:adenylate kinase